MDITRDVLIVEDDRCTRTLFAAIIEQHGFTTTFAADGVSALAHLRTAPRVIVLLDLLLPRVNGFEILREMECSNPPLLRRTIVVTAVSQRTIHDCAELRSVWRVLAKPIDVDELTAELLACAADDAMLREASHKTVKSVSQQERHTR